MSQSNADKDVFTTYFLERHSPIRRCILPWLLIHTSIQIIAERFELEGLGDACISKEYMEQKLVLDFCDELVRRNLWQCVRLYNS